MRQTIIGKIPSKSNQYIIAHNRLIKSKAVKDYEKSFYLQCNAYRNRNIAGLFELHCDIYHDSMRPDLDNAAKLLLDCLQNCKAIVNDNRLVKLVMQKFVDKEKPRVEFEIIEI